MARLIIAVHALVVVSLATCGSLAQSNPAIDSPASALRAVIDAIERKDAPALAGLIELPLPVNQHDSSLFAERLMLGSRLYWTLSDRFGPREALRVMRRARLDYLPRVDVQRVEWEPQLLPDPFDPRRRKDVLAGSIGGNRIERVHVVKTQTGFRLYHNDQPAMIALNVEDAPWRNRVVEDVLDGLRSGRIMTMEQVIAALVPRAPAQAEPAKADRTTPAGAVRAALDAIDRGDLETLRDSFEMIGGGAEADAFLRRFAEQAVLERQVEQLVRARFDADQAERIVRDGSLRRGHLVMYEQVEVWVIDGDVARGALKEGWYDVSRRIVRRGRIWRIQLPPRSTLPVDPEQEARQAARLRALREVLEHPERHATAAALLDAIDVTRAKARDDVDEAEAARRHLEEVKRWMAENPPQTPEEVEEQALAWSLWQLNFAQVSKDSAKMAEHYFAEGDDGSYVLARQKRALAAHELTRAAAREIGGEGSILHEFNLTNAADDVYGLFVLELKVQGDRAVPTNRDINPDEWVPPIRKIDGIWKIDVTEETSGNSRQAAHRALDEAQKLARITEQVRAGKFSNVDQLRRAMRDEQIRGVQLPEESKN